MNVATKPQERRESFIDPVDALNSPEIPPSRQARRLAAIRS